MMDSDSEDLDISLFSEKFKKSQKKVKKKKKNTKSLKDKSDDSKSREFNINAKTEVASMTELNETKTGNLAMKTVEEIKVDRTQKRDKALKRKHTPDMCIETSSMPVKSKRIKASTNSDGNEERELSEKQTKRLKQKLKFKTARKDSLGDDHESEEELNKLQAFIRTSSDESELESPKDKSKFVGTAKKLLQEKRLKGKTKHKDITDKKSKKKSNSDNIRSNNKHLTKLRSDSSESSSNMSNSDSDADANFKSVAMKVTKDGYESSTASEDNTEETKDFFDRGVDGDIGPESQQWSKKLEALPDEADEDESEEEDKYAAIKKELANIPLEDLVKIKEKLGLKVFSKIMNGGKFEAAKKKRVFKRENKNRPMEMSSKRSVPVLRHMDVPKTKVRRDPRFDDLSGEYNEEYFDRNYSFLQDVKAKEREVVKKSLKKSKNEEKKEKLQYLLNRMNQQEESAKQRQRQKELETSLKQKEKELVKEGKTPYFLKKAERRKLELAEKYKELQKSGKMDQYLSRKRKKNAQKQKKKLPGKHTRF